MIIGRYLLNSIIAKAILLFIIIGLLIYNKVELSVIVLSFLTIVALDFAHPLVLRNYFLVYTCLMFGVARLFFIPQDNIYTIHGIFYSFAFYVGTLIRKYLFKGRIIYKKTILYNRINRRISAVWALLIIILILKTLVNIYTILNTGISSYFGGNSMVSTIENYGQQNVSGGFDIILSSFFSSSIIAVVAMYVGIHLKNGRKLNYIALSYALLFLPLLSLSRNAFAFGLITMLLIYTMAENTKGRLSGKLLLYGAITLIFLTFVGITIGRLRESQINISSNAEASSSLMMVYGELSPIVAYETIKTNLDKGVLSHQYGKTIIPPIIFKVVPRSWYPDKPINSTAYYAQKTNSDAFENGFMIPSTFYGDLYLNFGLIITIFICIFFGYFVAVLDYAYMDNIKSVLFIYLIIHNNFYAFLRNNIPEGFMNIFLTFAIYFFYRLLIESLTRKIPN